MKILLVWKTKWGAIYIYYIYILLYIYIYIYIIDNFFLKSVRAILLFSFRFCGLHVLLWEQKLTEIGIN